MDINFDKIEEIYGINTVNDIRNNTQEIVKNIYYLNSLGFDDIEDIFESYTLMFLYDNKDFKNIVNKLINKLGINYIEKLEDNMELWGEV